MLPCERGGKRPHPLLGDSGGVHWATTDPAKIRRWWSLDPLANLGVATGVASALCIVDLDVKHGHDGPAELRAFLGGNTSLHAHPVARTPSGGFHIWMRVPAGARVPERPGLLPGLDIKGDGGLVIAPPSAQLVMPGGYDGERVDTVPVPYLWESGCPCSVPPAPIWMPGWLATAPARPDRHDRPIGEPHDIERLRREGIPAGERNATIYRVACGLFRKYGTDPRGSAEVVRIIEGIWRACDVKDFPWREVRSSINSARHWMAQQEQADRHAYGMAQPWMRTLDNGRASL